MRTKLYLCQFSVIFSYEFQLLPLDQDLELDQDMDLDPDIQLITLHSKLYCHIKCRHPILSKLVAPNIWNYHQPNFQRMGTIITEIKKERNGC